jgi:hypothetical protein
LRGVQEITAHVITCRGRKGTRAWECLETGLLEAFEDIHGKLPEYNRRKGAAKKVQLFRRKALRKLIQRFESD